METRYFWIVIGGLGEDSDPTYEAWKLRRMTWDCPQRSEHSDPTYEAWKHYFPISINKSFFKNSDPTYEAWKRKEETTMFG